MLKKRETPRLMGASQIIIVAFLVALLFAASALGMNSMTLISDSLIRVGMNAVFVIAMLPTIQCGVGLNFGLPIGIVCGLLGGLLTIEWNMTGVAGLLTAVAVSLPLAAAVGLAYGWLLNHLRGSEMMVGNYLNFSIISLMCIGWMILPFRNSAIVWAMGSGVRSTITLEQNYEQVLDHLWEIRISENLTIPTGTLLVTAVLCFAMWLFLRSKTGILMRASGSNPTFGASIGVDNDRMRLLGTMLSTMLGAIGIIIYAQSFGFYQLYNAPQMMAYPAIAAILIGGATTRKANLANVILGVILYQTILTVALPVASQAISDSSLSEILRTIVSNGIIIYALTKMGGRKV